MLKKNLIKKIAVFSAAILLIALGMVVSDKFKNKAKADVDSTIYFDPAETAVYFNQTFNLDAKINPGTNNKITAVTLNISFDATKFSLEGVNASSSFSGILGQTINNENGTASLSALVPSGGPSNAVTADGTTVVTFVFKSKNSAASSSAISFTSSTVAAALDENNNARSENVIAFRTPASITVNAKIYYLSDFVNLASHWMETASSLAADVNLDGKVNSKDLGIMMSSWSN